MYICKECGQQYKTKPEYCNCGNNEFKEPQTIKTTAKNYLDKIGISPFALLFFVICIILSLTILLLYNPQKQTNTAEPIKTIQTQTEIPNIDRLWVESTPKIDTTEVVSKPIVKEKIAQPAKKVVTTKTTTQKTTAKINNITTNKKTNSQMSSKQNTQTTTKIEKQKKSQINTQQVVPKTTSTPEATTKQTVTNESAKKNNQELYNYKVQLRQALFSKLSVVSIQGSGKCGIEFSIDSTGKLINRNFTYQSDNKTVNDEVYKMLMRMPQYYPPPTSYKGQKIKMVFSFDNGSYSINYTN